MDNREAAIAAAIRDLESGHFTSRRKAAAAYNIPESTLRGRQGGSQNRAVAHQNQQRLTPEQEESIVEWILYEDDRGYPPSHARAREAATTVLHLQKDFEPLGRRWIPTFIQRNPRVASVIGRKIEAKRATAATAEQIRVFLELFHDTRTRLNVHLEDIWNMDETGIGLGVCTNSRVLASSRKKKASRSSPENREWVSVIEAASATGQRLRPVVIFKGRYIQTTWFPSESVPNWFYTTSENGWTSNKIGVEWLRQIYIPDSITHPERYRLLILDGHGSHIDIEFMLLCRQHRIHLLFIPPHSSHVLQPLDLAPFLVIKTKYRFQIRELAALDDAAPVKKERFISSYHQARDQGLSPRVIRAGWKASGISPYNPQKVLESSQVINQPSTPPPSLPPQEALNIFYRTPQRPHDIYDQKRQLQSIEKMSRPTSSVLHKASKALSQAISAAARLENENKVLRQQLEQLKPTQKRKRVKVDQNQRFADIEAIKAALDQAPPEAKKTRKYTPRKAATKPVSP